MGGLFNIKSVEKIRDVQKVAVEESRLKIPMIFGMDVIHGYETVFPIPLGLSCTWDMKLIEHSARIAAIEASADGINWTFSPMVDIAVTHAGDGLQKAMAKMLTSVRKLQKPW